MKKSPLPGIIKFLVPVAFIIVLFFIVPLAGAVALVAAIVWAVWSNRSLLYELSGNKAYSGGDLAGAGREFEKAIATGKAKLSVKVSYSYVLLKQGRLEEARVLLTKLLESNITEEEKMFVKSNLALAIWKRGDVDGAVEMLEEVTKSYKNTTVYGSLGYLLILKGDLDRALEFNREAYEYNSTNTVIQDNLGQTLHLRGENEKAAEIYEKLLAANPTFPEAWYNSGLVMEALGDCEKAYVTMKKALDYKLTFLSTITREEIEKKLDEIKQNI